MDVLSVHSLLSSRISTPWGKPSNLWTFWVYPLRPRVPSWTWIRCLNLPLTGTLLSPLTFAMSTAMHNPAQTSSNLFWRPSCLSLTAIRTTHLWVTTSSLSLNRKYDFCYVYSIALTVATHILLWHLAAIIPSQLNNYFLPPFLWDLQHKGTLYFGCY